MGIAGGGGEDVGARGAVTSWRMIGSEDDVVSDIVVVGLLLDGDVIVVAVAVPRADLRVVLGTEVATAKAEAAIEAGMTVGENKQGSTLDLITQRA